MRQNKNTWFYMGGSGLERTDDFQKFCGSGLDRIQFYWIRTGLELKNFTVRSSLVSMPAVRLFCSSALTISFGMAGRGYTFDRNAFNVLFQKV